MHHVNVFHGTFLLFCTINTLFALYYIVCPYFCLLHMIYFTCLHTFIFLMINVLPFIPQSNFFILVYSMNIYNIYIDMIIYSIYMTNFHTIIYSLYMYSILIIIHKQALPVFIHASVRLSMCLFLISFLQHITLLSYEYTLIIIIWHIKETDL